MFRRPLQVRRERKMEMGKRRINETEENDMIFCKIDGWHSLVWSGQRGHVRPRSRYQNLFLFSHPPLPQSPTFPCTNQNSELRYIPTCVACIINNSRNCPLGTIATYLFSIPRTRSVNIMKWRTHTIQHTLHAHTHTQLILTRQTITPAT